MIVALAGLSALGAAFAAAWVDVREERLPNLLVVVVAGFPVTALVLGVASPRAVAVGLSVLAGPIAVLHATWPASFGFGDVKFAAALGACIGTIDASAATIALCVASGTTALVGVVGRRSVVPFGPGLTLGAIVAALMGPTLVGVVPGVRL